MDNSLLAILLTAILSILAAFGGVHLWVKKLVNAIKQSTDVGTALDNVVTTIDQVIEDNIVETGELKVIQEKFKKFRVEITEARDAWRDLFKKFK